MDKDGKRCPKGTPGARKVKERARKWYGAGIPGLPPGKRVPLASNKEAARQMLADRVRKAERGEAHLEDPTTRARDIPLSAHLESFERHLRNRAVSDKQVRQTLSRCRNVFDACGFAYPGDVLLEPVLSYLADRRKLPRDEGGLSVQSSNFYLGALSQFCRWMASPRERRMPENPFADAPRGNVRLDRRHDRRDLKPEELLKLFEAARNDTGRNNGLTGPQRYMLYHTTAGTGFRRKELLHLTPESFDLDANPPTVTVSVAYTKNKKKTVTQPLPPGLAAELRGYLAGRPAGQPAFPRGAWRARSSEMLRHDLEAAGIAYEVPGPDGPLYADFHALRHTYITLLERIGASPKDAQQLARHSTIVLTLDRYAHGDRGALASVVERLPLPGNDAPRPPMVGELAAAVVLLQTVLGFLVGAPGESRVARRVALTFEKGGDGGRRGETEGGENSPPLRLHNTGADKDLRLPETA